METTAFEPFYYKVVRLLAAYGLMLLWMIVIGLFYHWLGFSHGPPGWYVSRAEAFFAILVAPIGEEIMFRWLPWTLFGKNKGSTVQLAVIFGSSVIFGYMHGGSVGLFVQGIMGALFFWVYIRNGLLIWSMLLHALWNWWVLFGIALYLS